MQSAGGELSIPNLNVVKGRGKREGTNYTWVGRLVNSETIGNK
jgi:hypothetical protein